MIGRVVIVGALLTALPSICFAQDQKQYPDLPSYDPMKYCQNEMKIAGERSSSSIMGCLTVEQMSYDRLKAMWPTVTKEQKKVCFSELAMAKEASYSSLARCIDLERMSKERFKFKR
jgi:hypothetical protein